MDTCGEMQGRADHMADRETCRPTGTGMDLLELTATGHRHEVRGQSAQASPSEHGHIPLAQYNHRHEQ